MPKKPKTSDNSTAPSYTQAAHQMPCEQTNNLPNLHSTQAQWITKLSKTTPKRSPTNANNIQIAHTKRRVWRQHIPASNISGSRIPPKNPAIATYSAPIVIHQGKKKRTNKQTRKTPISRETPGRSSDHHRRHEPESREEGQDCELILGIERTNGGILELGGDRRMA